MAIPNGTPKKGYAVVEDTPEEARTRALFREEFDVERRVAAVEDTVERQRSMIDDLQKTVHGGTRPSGTRITDPVGSPKPQSTWWISLLTAHAKLIIILLFVVVFLLALVGQLNTIVQAFRSSAGH